MARGEPPNRHRTFPKKNGENAVIEWMKSYLMGLAGPLGAAADPSANIASQAGSFVPSQQLSAGGRVNPQIARDAINQRSIESYDRASLEAGGGLLAAGLAATAFRRPGAALARGFRAAPSQIAKQRGRSAAAMRAGGEDTAAPAPNRPSPQEMVQAAQAQQRMQPPQTRPPAGFPAGRTPRTDAPGRLETAPEMPQRPTLANPRDTDAPKLDPRVSSEDGGVNVNNVIKNALGRDGSKGLTKKDVEVSWDGTSDPTKQAARFRKIDPKTGKSVFWKDGHDSAKKSWKTAQTKADRTNPNATPSRLAVEEAGMTPQQLARARVNATLRRNPEVSQRLGEEAAMEDAAEAELRGLAGMMRRPPNDAYVRPAGRMTKPDVIDSTRKTYTTRKQPPKQKEGESDEAFARRLKNYESRYTPPVQRKGESKKAFETRQRNYEKRMEKERARQDAAADRNQPDRTSNPAPFSRNPFEDPEVTPGPAGRQPDGGVSRKANDPNTYQGPMDFRPSYMQGDMRTHYPSYLYGDLDQLPDARSVAQAASSAANQGGGAAAPAAVNPLNLPRFTPTRGKGSTRLRNVRKAADEAPKSNVADKPKAKSKKKSEETPEEVTIPKRSTKPKDTKKPKSQKKDVESPREAGEKPRIVFATPGKSTPLSDRPKPKGPFAVGSKPESTRGVSTPLSDRPKRQAPDGGFAMPGRKAASAKPDDPTSSRTRVGRGYTTAEQEKAIKDRAKTIYAAGDRAEKRKFAGMMALGAGGLAFPVMTIGNRIIDENVKKVSEEGAAIAAEEAVENPKSKEAKAVLRDKYGRKITREEYNRREAFRKKLEGMSPEDRKAARKKEMARREKWRESIGKQLFGKMAKKATRNLDLKEGVSSREVNKLMREAYGKSGSRQAAMDVRKNRKFARAS